MRKTSKLNLPIYDDPDNDFFDIQEWNESNESIDRAYSELITIKENLVASDPNIEILDARKGENSLGEKIDKIDSTLSNLNTNVTTINNNIVSLVIDGGTF